MRMKRRTQWVRMKNRRSSQSSTSKRCQWVGMTTLHSWPWVGFVCVCVRERESQSAVIYWLFFADSAFRNSWRMPWMVPLMWFVSDSNRKTKVSLTLWRKIQYTLGVHAVYSNIMTITKLRLLMTHLPTSNFVSPPHTRRVSVTALRTWTCLLSTRWEPTAVSSVEESSKFLPRSNLSTRPSGTCSKANLTYTHCHNISCQDQRQ